MARSRVIFSQAPHVGLAAGDAHMASDGGTARGAVDDEIMPLGLAPDRRTARGVEHDIVARLPQRRAQVGRVLLAQAHIQRARAGDPHAIAADEKSAANKSGDLKNSISLPRLLKENIALPSSAVRASGRIHNGVSIGAQIGSDALLKALCSGCDREHV